MREVSAGGNATNQTAGVINNNMYGAAPESKAVVGGGPLSNLPGLSKHIVPRPDDIDAIHNALRRSAVAGVVKQAAATADGGYGKTIAALLYAHEHEEDYPGGRFFIRCEQGSIVGEVASLAVKLGITGDLNDAEKAAAVKLKLEGGPACLIILDNVVDEAQWTSEEFCSVLPGGRARLLLTTRVHDLPDVQDVEIKRLTPAQGVEVLANFRGDANTGDNRAHAADLVEQVEGLAVAVAAIGAYMKLTPEANWEGLAGEVRRGSIGLIQSAEPRVASQIGYRTAVVEVLDAAIDSLPPAERRAMEYAALLPADLVPRFWLVTLLERDATLTLVAKPAVVGPPAGAAVDHLVALDLLRAPAGPAGLMSMHRAHRARLAERLEAMPEETARLLDAIVELGEERGKASHDAVAGDLAEKDEAKRRAGVEALWAELTPLVALAGALAEHGRFWAAVRLANWVNTPLNDLGRYGEGWASLARFAVNEAALVAGTGQEEAAALFSNLAMMQRDQGDLPGARKSMERAITVGEKHFAPDQPIHATYYSNLALIQQDQGDLKGARASIERAIAIEEKHFAPDHPTLATSYMVLAYIQSPQGDLPGARASIERAIAIEQKHFAPDHPTFAISYNNMQSILFSMGDYLGAREYMQRAMGISAAHFAPDHPSVGVSYSNLGTIDFMAGDHAAACSNLKKGLEIFLKHFDESHPRVKWVRGLMKETGCTP